MANREHGRILMQGINAWNEWRARFPSIEPDLSRKDLKYSILRGADLKNTDLSGADLRDANLRRADLSGARLDNTKLYRTFISKARLNKTSFRGAILYETVLADLDLSSAMFLETCLHKGHSILDHRTLARSKDLPIEFLRGCGLPDFIINQATTFRRSISKYNSCFLSYSSKDQSFAERLHADLQDKGVRCWFAPEDLKIGDKFRQQIDQSILSHDKLLLILSENSISSTWVEEEVERAMERERREDRLVLFPIRIDDSVLNNNRAWASSLRIMRHIGDFKGWKNHDTYQVSFQRLLRDLRAQKGGDRA